MREIPLLFGAGGDYDVELEYIYQPGYPLMTYNDHFLCVWNVTFPKDPCIFAEYDISVKDFHTTDPSNGAECENQDHTHIRYETNRNEYHCGSENQNNCPDSNCITQRIISGECYCVCVRV